MSEPDKDENQGAVAALNAALDAISERLASDVLVINAEMGDKCYRLARQLVNSKKFRPNVFVILSTYGGDAAAAYRIGRLLRDKYDRIMLFVPGLCKSAGTLLALAADELVIADEGELGPLDAQILKHDELGEFGSGLSVNQTFDFLKDRALETFRAILLDVRVGGRLTTKMSAEIATNLTVGLLAPIYQQIDSLKLGEMSRSIMVAYDYGRRLKSKNVRQNSLQKLIAAYPSHGFVIDRNECGELFVNVRAPESDELTIANLLATVFKDPSNCFVELFQRDDKSAENRPGETHNGPDGTGEDSARSERGIQVDISNDQPNPATTPTPVNGHGRGRRSRKSLTPPQGSTD